MDRPHNAYSAHEWIEYANKLEAENELLRARFEKLYKGAADTLSFLDGLEFRILDEAMEPPQDKEE